MKIVTTIIVMTQLTAVLSHAEHLFSDTFDRPNSPKLYGARTTDGQGGVATPLRYSSPTDDYFKNENITSIENKRLRMCNGNNASIVTLDSHNFINKSILNDKGFSVSINILSRTAPSSKNDSNTFVGFGIGMSGPDISKKNCITDIGKPGGGPRGDFFGAPGGNADFYTSWSPVNGGSIQIFTRTKAKGFQIKANAPYGGILRADFHFDTFRIGAPVSAEIYMNNKLIGRTSFNWSKSERNYIALSANQNGNTIDIDNLVIETLKKPKNVAAPAKNKATKRPVITTTARPTSPPKNTPQTSRPTTTRSTPAPRTVSTPQTTPKPTPAPVATRSAPSKNWSTSKNAPGNSPLNNPKSGGTLNIDWFNKAGIYSRTLGQSFTTDKPFTAKAITVKVESRHDFDSRKHVLQLAVLKGGSSLGKTVLGSIGEYDFSNSTLNIGDYLTLVLPQPITIDAFATHHFELFWTSPDLAHAIQVAYTPNAAAFREGDAYSRAGGTFFPVGTSLIKMPSQDLTFYIHDEIPQAVANNVKSTIVKAAPAQQQKIVLPGASSSTKSANTATAKKKTTNPLNILALLGLIPPILLLMLRKKRDF